MDLFKMNASNVHQLAIPQIDEILRTMFTAEEWANTTQLERTRYGVLCVAYIKQKEFHERYTLTEFVRERKSSPSPRFRREQICYNDNEDRFYDRKRKGDDITSGNIVRHDPVESAFKMPPPPKRKCNKTIFSKSEQYYTTGTYLSSKMNSTDPDKPVPSTSEVITNNKPGNKIVGSTDEPVEILMVLLKEGIVYRKNV